MTRIDNREAHEEIMDREQSSIEVNGDNLASRTAELRLSSQKAAYIATSTRTLAVSMLDLPNAYETFRNDPSHMRRAGNYLKAYTYEDFMYHPDEPERIFEVPVAKAVARAMDTVTAYTSRSLGSTVRRFGVAGYSKLGTATW